MATADARVETLRDELRTVRDALAVETRDKERTKSELAAVHGDLLGVRKQSAALMRHTIAAGMGSDKYRTTVAFQQWIDAVTVQRQERQLRVRDCGSGVFSIPLPRW